MGDRELSDPTKSYVVSWNSADEWWHPVATYEREDVANATALELNARMPKDFEGGFSVTEVSRSPIFATTGLELYRVVDLDDDEDGPWCRVVEESDLGMDQPPFVIEDVFSDRARDGIIDRGGVWILAPRDDPGEAIDRAIDVWEKRPR